jgi:hypothetical protein
VVRKILLVNILFLLISPLLSQIRPSGKFLKNKTKIGEHIFYSLSVRYPVNQDILFPDSTYAFTPFEFVEKRFFNTKSDSVYSYDSVVYTLSTFELDSIQHLALPVFLIENGDSTKFFSVPDSILVTSSLSSIPNPPKMMVNANYIEVVKDFNYRYLLFGLGVLLLIAVLLFLIFGKTIMKRIKIKRIRAQHYKFLVAFKELNSGITADNYELKLQGMYSLWKSYLQQLTDMHFTSYSTKDISKLIVDESLKDSLQKIDRAIYAHRFPEQHQQHTKILQEYAQKFYEQKTREISNGSKKR